MSASVLHGDCRDVLPTLASASVQCCVTSPPYWGLRDYGHAEQLGLERTPEEYVDSMVAVFREVRRVLRDDGTLWLNLGDSYAHSTVTIPPHRGERANRDQGATGFKSVRSMTGLKPKDLVGIPWRVAFALQADGWTLRSDIIWSKPNPMPESVRDRPTKAHEYLFLLTKGKRYFYDADAVSEPAVTVGQCRHLYADSTADARLSTSGRAKTGPSGRAKTGKPQREHRNRRTVWTVAPKPFKGAHFAVMPPGLVEPCVLAGSRPGDVVLDPFAGSGTTGAVALSLGRSFIGVELNPEYAEMVRQRLASAPAPLPLTARAAP